MTGPLLLTLDEAARSLSMSKRKVEELVYGGDLPSVRVGRCRRIAAQDLADYVDRLRQENDRQQNQHLAVVSGGRRERPARRTG
jgi:excisionase family DNA binding protein